MPIRQLLDSNAFNRRSHHALRRVRRHVRALQLVDRSDPVTSLIAKKIIELARRGEHDPAFASSGRAGVLGCSGTLGNASANSSP